MTTKGGKGVRVCQHTQRLQTGNRRSPVRIACSSPKWAYTAAALG